MSEIRLLRQKTDAHIVRSGREGGRHVDESERTTECLLLATVAPSLRRSANHVAELVSVNKQLSNPHGHWWGGE